MTKTISFPPEVGANGNLVIANELEGLRQKLISRLYLFRGTWFLDITEGVPYFEEVLVKPIDPGFITSLFNTEILKETDVTGLGQVDFTFDRNTRHFTYSAVVKTTFGETSVEVL